jgi:hypothetical protein
VSLWADYAQFHEAQTQSRDMDPAYPVLKWFADSLDRESGLWLTFLFVGYYHMGSALKAFSLYPALTVPDETTLKLPIAQPRRSHRATLRFAQHLDSLCAKAEQHGGLSAWLDSATTSEDPLTNWKTLNDELTTVFGNGRWAAYKTAEILMKSHGFNLAAPDMGNANSSGPRKGLGLFFPGLPQGNSPAEIAYLDELSLKVVENLTGKTSQVSIETAETSLCDFYALNKGRYYVGIDIDEMQEQLLRVPSDLTAMAFKARHETLPHAYLGELNGWEGIDKNRKSIYRDTKQIALR